MQPDRVQQIEHIIHSAIGDLCDYYKKYGGNRDTVFKRLLNKEDNSRLRKQYLDEDPEKYIEKHLVWPLLSTLGYEFKTEEHIGGGSRVDFLITNTSEEILGEVKLPGNHEDARNQLQRYLETSDYGFGFSTDGFYWEFSHHHESTIDNQPDRLIYGDLRGIAAAHIEEMNYLDLDPGYMEVTDYMNSEVIQTGPNVSPTTAEQFYSDFRISSIENIFA